MRTLRLAFLTMILASLTGIVAACTIAIEGALLFPVILALGVWGLWFYRPRNDKSRILGEDSALIERGNNGDR